MGYFALYKDLNNNWQPAKDLNGLKIWETLEEVNVKSINTTVLIFSLEYTIEKQMMIANSLAILTNSVNDCITKMEKIERDSFK